MAQIKGEASGFQVDVMEDLPSEADDNLSPVAQMFWDAMRCYERGQIKASAAHAVNAINTIASEHSITCGASL